MAQNDSNRQSFLHGAAILALATVLIKVIGAAFKIPLINILGSEGFSNFTVAYNIYSFFLTVSTTGLPVALAKMISEANALERENEVRRTYSVAFKAFIFVGLVGTLIMALFCKPIAKAMGDELAWSSILALAPALLFVCAMSSFRGYFQGLSNMKPTATSQIIEALGKLVFGIGLSWLIVKNTSNVFLGSAGSIVGVTIGTMLGVIYLVSCKVKNSKTRAAGSDTPRSNREIFAHLMRLAVPITLGSSVLSLFTMVDNAVVLNRLQSALGYTASLARSLNGSYGAAQTIYNFPVAFITPLTVSIIPHISECITLAKHKMAARLTESAMRITALIAFPAAMGLGVCAWPVLRLLYFAQPDVYTVAAPLLQLLCPVIVFNSFVLLTNAILQSNGYVKVPLYAMVGGGIIKVAVNWVLVGIPALNIKGAPIGSICCFGFIAIFNIVAICRLIPEKPSLGKVFVKPAICTVVMGAAVWGVYHLAAAVLGTDSFMRVALTTGASVGVGVVVYAVLVVVTKAITVDDVSLLPKSDKIASLLRLK